MKKSSNFLWGIVFIILALVIILNTFDLLYINLFFKGWWTLFIIIPAFIGLFTDREKTGNLIALVIGAALLLMARGLLDWSIVNKLILPVIFLIIGINLIFKDTIHRNISAKVKELNKGENADYSAVFSEQNVRFEKDEFKSLDTNAIFGGVKLDLRDCEIAEDQVINSTAIFGGIEIIFPTTVNVKAKSTSIFGGLSNKVHLDKDDSKKTIYVNSFNLFGGTELK